MQHIPRSSAVTAAALVCRAQQHASDSFIYSSSKRSSSISKSSNKSSMFLAWSIYTSGIYCRLLILCANVHVFATVRPALGQHVKQGSERETWRTTRFILSSLLSTLYSLLSTLYSVLSTLYSLLSTLYTSSTDSSKDNM